MISSSSSSPISIPKPFPFPLKIHQNPKNKTKFPKMLGKKMGSIKKLAKKAKAKEDHDDSKLSEQYLLRGLPKGTSPSSKVSTPTGFFAIYVGEGRERFVVPTSFLSHPLFKMLLEKSYDESGTEQTKRLVVPCSVSTFQEVVNAVACCNGRFDFGNLVEEFV